MNQPKAIFLIGPPASGKSTYRDHYLVGVSRPTVVLSSDDLIEEFGKTHGLNYTEAFAKVNFREIGAKLQVALEQAVAADADIIIDRTNMGRKSRNDFLKQIPLHYIKEAVVFSVSRIALDARLKDREEQTGKHIPATVVDNMLASYVPPSQDEFDMIRFA